MHFHIYISSATGSASLNQYTHPQFFNSPRKLILKLANVSTNSSTRKFYLLELNNDLGYKNNISYKNSVPLFVDTHEYKLDIGNLDNLGTLNYNITNEDGTTTSDTIKMSLLFELQ